MTDLEYIRKSAKTDGAIIVSKKVEALIMNHIRMHYSWNDQTRRMELLTGA